MDTVTVPLNFVARQVNSLFANREPWQVATMTATTVLSAVWLWEVVSQDESKFQSPHCNNNELS